MSEPVGEVPEVVGARIRAARVAKGMRQQDVADELGVSRPLLVSIEQGQRMPRANELIVLGRLFDRPVGELLRPSRPMDAMAVQFRAVLGGKADNAMQPVVELLQRLADDYVELARHARVDLSRDYPVEASVVGLDIANTAESLAASERTRLGLGDGPVLDLRQLLEDEVGLRIFAPLMPGTVSGIFAMVRGLGACVAVNANHPYERQRWTLSHEYAHFLTSRSKTEITQISGHTRQPATERFAEAFAANFLMPRISITRRWHQLSQSREGGTTPADMMQLAHVYRVSASAMTVRLEDLRLIPSGSLDSLKTAGFRFEEARSALGLQPYEPDVDLLPLRYQYLAVELYTREEISEGQLAQFLQTDRVSARRVVESLTRSTDVDGSGALTHTAFGAIGLDLQDEV